VSFCPDVPKRVLVVEDDPRLRSMLGMVLRWHGYRVDEARHGAEALSLARGAPPDVILTDLDMPVMDGMTLATKCHESEALDRVPIIVMSAATDLRRLRRHWPDGSVSAHLAKPFGLDALTATVERVAAAPS
jgi:CheY-like chemotaxis protein